MTTQQKKTLRRVRRRRDSGFNLTEIMIALAILSLVIGAVAFTGFNQLKKSQMKTTRNTMHNIESALVQWQADTGETCPSSLNDLAAKKILNKAPADGWGKPFRFKCPGEHNNEIDLVSNGPDGKAETEDDVRSWEDEKKKE